VPRSVNSRKAKPNASMTHEQRLELIYRGLPPVRVLPISYPYGGVFVNDYFGEHLDARRADASTVYEGAFARELQAVIPTGDDSTEVRQFIESQTRSRRSVGTKGAWA
jgi:hypothetical protein